VRRSERCLPRSIDWIKAAWVNISEWIVRRVSVTIEALRVARTRHDGVRLQEPAQREVVESRAIVHQPRAGIPRLAGVGGGGLAAGEGVVGRVRCVRSRCTVGEVPQGEAARYFSRVASCVGFVSIPFFWITVRLIHNRK